MNCPKCGAPMDADATFCVVCGSQIKTPDTSSTVIKAESQPQDKPASYTQAKGSSLSTRNIIGLVIGTLLIVIGFIRIFTAGTTISPTSFGGDFYTYTYKGIVAVSEILASIEVSLGWVIIAIGAAIDVSSIKN